MGSKAFTAERGDRDEGIEGLHIPAECASPDKRAQGRCCAGSTTQTDTYKHNARKADLTRQAIEAARDGQLGEFVKAFEGDNMTRRRRSLGMLSPRQPGFDEVERKSRLDFTDGILRDKETNGGTKMGSVIG